MLDTMRYLYADDTHLYLCMDKTNPSTSLELLRTAIIDIRIWMITYKLKINYDKTDFLVITKPQISHVKDFQLKIGATTYRPLIVQNVLRSYSIKLCPWISK